MAKQKGSKNNLSNKFRFSIFNDTSHEELFTTRASGIVAILSGVLLILLIVIVITLLIAFTPIRHMIPGYPSAENQRELVQDAMKLDSLQEEVRLWKQQLTNIQLIITGQEPVEIRSMTDSIVPSDSSKAAAARWAEQEQKLLEEVEKNLQEPEYE